MEPQFGALKDEAAAGSCRGKVRVRGIVKTGLLIAFALATTNRRLALSWDAPQNAGAVSLPVTRVKGRLYSHRLTHFALKPEDKCKGKLLYPLRTCGHLRLDPPAPPRRFTSRWGSSRSPRTLPCTSGPFALARTTSTVPSTLFTTHGMYFCHQNGWLLYLPHSAPGRSRTRNLTGRNRLLYPVELQGRAFIVPTSLRCGAPYKQARHCVVHELPRPTSRTNVSVCHTGGPWWA